MLGNSFSRTPVMEINFNTYRETVHNQFNPQFKRSIANLRLTHRKNLASAADSPLTRGNSTTIRLLLGPIVPSTARTFLKPTRTAVRHPLEMAGCTAT